ncbi:universal stress protein [Halalkalicoccus salilacus]|uniref:universal stress protein n=1 Tax=Halalkalicoccus TaxID=332246 RepID=UPI002F96BC73
MYERILVPTDGSEQSERAADHALEIARQFGSAVHAIHVVDDRGPGRAAEAVSDLSPSSSERQAMNERREEAGNELTAAVTDRAREAGLDAYGEVLHGEPADQITEYAQANDMDLIVLGARGRSAVGKFLLGSVAGKVSRHATTPVMLIRADG